jgi:surfactin synthase thioesterase subunit
MFVEVLEGTPGAVAGYAFPHVGGTAAGLAPAARALTAAVRLRCLDLPGRLGRIAEPPRTGFPDLAADATAAIAAEVGMTADHYMLLGVCGGASLALEVARALRAARVRPPAALVVVSAAAPDIALLPYRIADLQSDALWEWLSAHGGLPGRLGGDAAFRRLAERALRADFALFADYLYRPGPPLDVPILALYGAKDDELARGEVLGWQRQSSLPLTAVRVPDRGRWLLTEAPDAAGPLITAVLS